MDHGVINEDDEIICDSDYHGDNCDIKRCPNECNGNGICDKGFCLCDATWTGEECNIKECPLACSFHGTCVDGVC